MKKNLTDRNLQLILFLIYITVVPNCISAESRPIALSSPKYSSDTLFSLFEKRFAELDNAIYSQNTSRATVATQQELGTKNAVLGHKFLREDDLAEIDSVVDNQVRAKISEFRSATGLSINGQIYTRLDEGLGMDEDDAVSRYKNKIQADLRWNIFGSSLIHRKGHIKEIKLKGEITKLDYRRHDFGRMVAFQKEEFRMRYESMLSGILAHRIHNLSLLADALFYLLDDGDISSDDLLSLLNEKAEAERVMATIDNPSAETVNLSSPGALVVRVDSTQLMSYISKYNTETSTLELRKLLLDQQIDNTTYWSTLNVSPFIRYSYYTRPVLDNSTNVDLGVSFIVPVSGQTAKKRRALKADREVLGLESDHLMETISDNVNLIMLNIGRMNRSIEGEVARLAELKSYLRLRKVAYTERIGEYNYLARMKEYNTYLSCWERLLDFCYQRDVLLASLQAYLPDVSILDFCSSTEIQAN